MRKRPFQAQREIALFLSSVVLALLFGCAKETRLPPGAEPNATLLDASRAGDLALVKACVRAGADVNHRAEFGVTPLWHACRKGHVDVAKWLLDQGADPDARDEVFQSAPLHLAKTPDLVMALVEHGATDGADWILRAVAASGDTSLARRLTSTRRYSANTLATAKALALLYNERALADAMDASFAGPLPSLPQLTEEDVKPLVGVYLTPESQSLRIEARGASIVARDAGGQVTLLICVEPGWFDAGRLSYRFSPTNLGAEVERLEVLRDGAIVQVYEPVIEMRNALTNATEFIPKRRPAPKSAPRATDTADTSSYVATDCWPSFRGWNGRGLAEDQHLPSDWSVPDQKGVLWRTPIEGLSNASPIVWKDNVFVVTAVSEVKQEVMIGDYREARGTDDFSEHDWKLICFNASNGERRWERVAQTAKPRVGRHPKSSQANATPVTDGEHVVVLFNSGGLFCYSFEGAPKWNVDLGVLDSGATTDPEFTWGFASSPILWRGLVIVQCDVRDRSELLAYRLSDGSLDWRTKRDEPPTWSTPAIMESTNRTQVITAGVRAIRGYDAMSGKEIWKKSGLSATVIPTPLVEEGVVIATSGNLPNQPIVALAVPSGPNDNDLDPATEKWRNERGGAYTPTPILHQGLLYVVSNAGVLTCYDAETGENLNRKRIAAGNGASLSASPVMVDQELYFTCEDGSVIICDIGKEFEVKRSHQLGEPCLATPAVAGGVIYFRTSLSLIAIGQKKTP